MKFWKAARQLPFLLNALECWRINCMPVSGHHNLNSSVRMRMTFCISHTHTFRQGNCVPYMTTPGGGLCDSVYEAGVDYVYVPFTRLNGNLTAVASILQHFVIFIDILAEECKPIVLHALMCFYYLPPCGNSTHFVPPPAICHDECLAASEVLCPDEFNGYTSFVEDISSTDFEALGFNVVNCSNPGQYINPLPHCCYTVTGERKRDSVIGLTHIPADQCIQLGVSYATQCPNHEYWHCMFCQGCSHQSCVAEHDSSQLHSWSLRGLVLSRFIEYLLHIYTNDQCSVSCPAILWYQIM